MSLRISYRTVFLSDVHLGSAASRADDASEFLKHIDCQTLYLVGDIIDMWRLRARWHWPESHNRFVRRVLKMAKRGTRVILIPGNHDDKARDYTGLNFGGVELALEAVHLTADNRRLLIVHGDEVDAVIRHARILSMLGGAAYDQLVLLNRWSNRLRAAIGLKPWSLSQAIKLRVKKACQHIARFEETLASEAERRDLDGVVCGHIHKAESRRLEARNGRAVEYHNCGDWVESCTALVEHDDGTLRIVDGLAMIEQWRSLETSDQSAESDEPIASPSRGTPQTNDAPL